MTNEKYIPGFDIIKVFGCCLIAFSHVFLGQFIARYTDINFNVFFGLFVPIYFLIAGYLMRQSIDRKENPFGYIRKYTIKYALAYYAVAIFTLFPHYIDIWKTSGIFMYKDFIYVLVTMPVLNLGTPYQLWFIPPLLVGIWLCGAAKYYNKEQLMKYILFPVAIVFIGCLVFSGYLYPLFPSMYGSRAAILFWDICSRYLRGFLFVFIGMELCVKKEQFLALNTRPLLPLLALLSIGEMWLYYRIPDHVISISLSFTVLFWSTIAMKPILRYKNDKIGKCHNGLTVFSGLMFFLHISEQRLFAKFISGDMLVFAAILIVNLLLTALLCKKRMKSENHHENEIQAN